MTLRTIGILVACLFISTNAAAQAWPAKPMRWIVSYGPATTGDIFARLIGGKVADSLKEQIIIDNRDGANGNIGTTAGAKAPPDGYTFLLSGNASLAINPHITSTLQYDPVKDFSAVMLIGSVPLLLNANPDLKITNVKDLLALARARPGQVDFASGGNGTSTHLAGVLLNMMANVDLRHVPYKSGQQAINDLIAGHVKLMFTGLPTTMGQVKAGKLLPLAVTGLKRSAAMPEVPALAETLPGFEVGVWYGLLAPAGTPAPIVNRMAAEIGNVLKDPAILERFKTLGADPGTYGPAEFTTYIRDELNRWGKVVKIAQAKVD